MPKMRYPALVVTPANLVPACADCNKAKLEAAPLSSLDATLHPYFDNIEDDLWLEARVLQTYPAALRFGVKSPSHWLVEMTARVEYHFNLLSLSSLYASHAAEELISIRHGLSGLHERAGASAVRQHLADRAASSARGRTNSWQTAAYRAWAGSAWFCDRGFA